MKFFRKTFHYKAHFLRRWLRRVLRPLVYLLAVLVLVWPPYGALAATVENTAANSPYWAEALVLVNSDSPAYPDFTRWIQPYLENFGIPYQLLDLAQAGLPADLDRYALVIIGHARLDLDHSRLDDTAQQSLVAAVQAGTGLVNFDNDLSNKNRMPRYSYVQDLFGFQYGIRKTGWTVRFRDPAGHYITARHSPGEQLSTGMMTTAGFRPPEDFTVLALTGDGQPFLAAGQVGTGRVVQWTSYDWIADPARGPMSGLDDLVWRSLVWAARKPFVMQALPPFLTMRVDDVSGPLWWVHTAGEEFALKPWLGVFISDFSSEEATDLSSLVKAGHATAMVHAFNMENFLYADHLARQNGSVNLPAAAMERNLEKGQSWHTRLDIPQSKFTVGHYYELSADTFNRFDRWGVEFVGLLVEPGQRYGSTWVQAGPYRQGTRGSSKSTRPFYYADDLQVPGHPELDGKFFNCMTEIRDDAGYEWFPGKDVAGSVTRGVRQSRRALDSLALATLFTHEYHIMEAGPQKWRAILEGVTEQLAEYQPRTVTLDQACQYARAIHHSSVNASRYDPAARQLTTTLEGRTDLSTELYLFTEQNGVVTQQWIRVPVFEGSVTVTTQVP